MVKWLHCMLPRGTSPKDFSLTDVDLEKPAYANFTFAPAFGL